MESKIKSFDRNGDVKVFIEKLSIHSSLKGYENEKAAQNLASRLEGRAFDVYMRLSDADKKEFSKIKAEVLKEFERGNQDREVAIHELSTRSRKQDESAQTFAYKIQELVKLAYPEFDENTRSTISKDYYIKGLGPNQVMETLELSKLSMQKHYNRNTRFIDYREGQKVRLKTKHYKTGENRKLAPRRNGPWTILQQLPNGVNFKIRNRNNETKVVHHDRLLPAAVNNDESSAELSGHSFDPQDLGNHSEISSDTSSSSESDSEVDEDDSVDSEPEMIDLPLRRRSPRRNRQARQFQGTIPWDAFAD